MSSKDKKSHSKTKSSGSEKAPVKTQGKDQKKQAQIAKKKSLTCLQKIKSVSLATTLVQ